MLEDSGAAVLLTYRRFSEIVPAGYMGTVLSIDGMAQDRLPPSKEAVSAVRKNAPLANDLLYIFYTSGTTGKPKGVMVEHTSLVHRISWLQRHHQLTPGKDAVLHKTAYGFGVSEWEIFWPLLSGTTLVLAKPGGHRDPRYLVDLIQAKQISILFQVPSMLHVILEYLESEPGAELSSVQHVFCAGEALRANVCRAFHAGAFPHSTLHNLYGPTEADMTSWTSPARGSARLRDLEIVPAGKPIDNSNVYVMNDELQPLPVGETGEMCFASVGTARGYLGLDELTAKCMLPPPDGGDGRMYRTGDLGRWNQDGTLEYLGRRDRQVKVRGVRMELGDIEAALLKCDALGVRNAVVILYGDTPATQQLIGYVTPATLEVEAVLAALRKVLPAVMVPSALVPLNTFPLTTNGKLDRRALPMPPKPQLGTVVAGRNELEVRLAELWGEVLGAGAPVSVEETFELLGGNSLLAGRVVATMRKKLGITVDGIAMFRFPTVAKLAAHISEEGLDRRHSRSESVPPIPFDEATHYKGHNLCSPLSLSCQTIAMLLVVTVDELPGILQLVLSLGLYSKCVLLSIWLAPHPWR
jgi:amino acid adenylation domain-containing protein